MNDTALQDDLVRKADDAAARLAEAREAAGKIILGQDEVLDLSFGAILAGGHGLLVGAPGLAKTKLVETLGVVLGLDSGRVQFTPDLMPPDILGSEVLEEGADGKRAFRFIAGPIFCQLLMADEINRASPRTQSALLQAMQEHHVTVAGKRYDLPEPFHVLATQNPIEQEGTYPLPEAQLDRFLYQVDVPYPKLDAERDILLATTGSEIEQPKNVLTAKELMEAQALVRQIPVGEKVLEAILKLVRLARPDDSPLDLTREFVAWGPGPRAGQALMLGVRARALMTGRLAPSTDDVARLAKPALKHRMALSFGARAEGVTLDSLIDRLISELD